MRMIRGIATVSAGSLTALGLALGIGACGVASASVRPATATTYVMSATGRADHGTFGYLPGRVNITLGGPDGYARGLHWSQWNDTSATAHGTLVLSDAATWTVPGVTLRFSHPVTEELTVNGHNRAVRYFEDLHISANKSIAPY